MEEFCDFVDSNSILRRFKPYVERYVLTIQFVDLISQCCFVVGMTGIVSVGILISIPNLYTDANSVFTARFVGFFIAFQILANWLSVKFVDSKYQPFRHGTKPDNIDIGQNFRHYPTADENQNGGSITTKGHTVSTAVNIYTNTDNSDENTRNNAESETGEVKKEEKYPYFSWKPCFECNRPHPPRSHHCADCNKCVLKRDHHCFFAGNCIGYRNMRHFSMFVFYSFAACIFAEFHALPYYYYYVLPETRFADLFVPFGCLRALFGFIKWSDVFTITLGWALHFFLIISRTYVFIVIRIIRTGQTSFEMTKKIGIIDTRSLSQKLRAVYGHYWALNFLMPLHFVFEPIEDPVTWPTIVAPGS